MNINFVEIESEKIKNELIQAVEAELGETLYPGDERRIFLLQMVPALVGLRNSINDTGRQNLLRYARDQYLDAKGEYTERLQPQKANVTLKWALSAAQATAYTIPKGKRVAPDGLLYFATAEDCIIPVGQIEGTVTAEATEAGEKHNGFAPGQITKIIDPMPFVASVVNTDTSSGGSNIEADDHYRERIRQERKSSPTTGSTDAYDYWAKTADVNIVDVQPTSPSPGVVKLTVLMMDGGLPTQATLNAVSAAVTDKKRRPLTDNVQAAAPAVDTYNINLTYYISAERQNEATAIRNTIEASGGSIDQFKAWQCAKLGRAINPDYLRGLLLNAGAFKVDITSPIYSEVNIDHVAKAGIVNVIYGGLI